MLILPPGHAHQAPIRWRPSRRERWVIGSSLALVAALAAALVVAFASQQRTSQHGCIDVSAATVIGGSELYRCGTAARELCTERGPGGTEFVSFQRALASACRKAGLPVPFTSRQG